MVLLVFKLKKKDLGFTVFKSNGVAVIILIIIILLSALKYIKAGLDYFMWNSLN